MMYKAIVVFLILPIIVLNYLLHQETNLSFEHLIGLNLLFLSLSILLWFASKIIMAKAKNNIGLIFSGMALLGFLIVFLGIKQLNINIKMINFYVFMLYFIYFTGATTLIVEKLNKI